MTLAPASMWVRKTHVVYTLVLLRFRKRPRACTCLSTKHSSAHRPWGSPSDEASVTQGSCALLASLLVCTRKGPFAKKVGEWDECTRRATSALSPRPGHGSRFSLSTCSCTPRSVQHCRKFYLIMGQLCEWSWGCVAGPPILSHSCHSHLRPLPSGQVWWALRLQQVRFWSQAICPPCRGGWKRLLETVSVPRGFPQKQRRHFRGRCCQLGLPSTVGMMPSSAHGPE